MLSSVPASIDVKKSRGLHITWSDASVGDYSLEQLRSMCPCATCREQRAGKKTSKPLLKVLPGNYAGDVVIESVELVGNYAIKITWTDGHDSGIYSFKYLHELRL